MTQHSVLRFLLLSTVFAVCAVVATALAQIFTNTYQKSLDCNAMQLLYHTSPLIALVSFDILCCIYYLTAQARNLDGMLTLSYLILSHVTSILIITFQGMIVMCPFFDDLSKLTNFEYTTPCVLRIGNVIFICDININYSESL